MLATEDRKEEHLLAILEEMSHSPAISPPPALSKLFEKNYLNDPAVPDGGFKLMPRPFTYPGDSAAQLRTNSWEQRNNGNPA